MIKVKLVEYRFGICTVQINDQKPQTCGIDRLKKIRRIFAHGQIVEDIKVDDLCPVNKID